MQVQIRMSKGQRGLLNSRAWFREPSFFLYVGFHWVDVIHPHYGTSLCMANPVRLSCKDTLQCEQLLHPHQSWEAMSYMETHVFCLPSSSQQTSGQSLSPFLTNQWEGKAERPKSGLKWIFLNLSSLTAGLKLGVILPQFQSETTAAHHHSPLSRIIKGAILTCEDSVLGSFNILK